LWDSPTVSSSPFCKNEGVDPANRHNRERTSATRAHNNGKTAEKRMFEEQRLALRIRIAIIKGFASGMSDV
jgi:hypothetical protein